MANVGFARKFGWRPPKVPKAIAGPGGGVGPVPPAAPRAGATAGGDEAIPGTYEPAWDAKKRAAERGEHDTLQNLGTERHFGEKDLHQALTDIHTSVSRKRQSLGIDFNRGNEKIGNQEADVTRNAGRTQADFTTKLADIARRFGELGRRQGEGANAAGVNDAGTAAASAAARARNQIRSEEPIHTGEGRLKEDLNTALNRLGTSRGQLGQDFGIATSQLNQNRDRERSRAKQETVRLWGTGKPDGFIGTKGREEERTKREGAIAPVDILESEVWEGRQNHPGAYATAGNAKKKGKR